MDTNLKEKPHTFTWKISDVSFLTLEKGEFIQSPDFIVKNLHETSWHLEFYLRGDDESDIHEMSCYLRRSVNCDGPLEAEGELKFEVIYENNKIFSSNTDFAKFCKGESYGLDIYEGEKLSNESLSLDSTLTIHCDLNTIKRQPILLSGSIGLTKVGIDQCSFKWVVKNLNSNCLETMKFPYTGASQVEITVQAPGDDIEIFIRKMGSTTPHYVKCRMTLLDLKGIERDSKEAAHLFKAGHDIWKYPSFLKKSKLNSEKEKYLQDDSFTLHCEVSVSHGTVTSVIDSKDESDPEILLVMPCIDNLSALKADIARMYTEKSQTDVELIVNKKIFPAHKFILSARSPVFFAMFNQDMIENKSGQVDITDLEAKTLDILLEFMYTGAVKNMDCEMATKLLLAADKYQVLILKKECSTFLRSVLTDSSVCDVLAAADLIEEEPLKVAAIRFIKTHSRKVLKSVEWKRFVEKNLTLATDVVCEISTLLAEHED